VRARSRSGAIGPWVVVLCLVAASLWCQDSLRPIRPLFEGVRIKPWLDGFYHAVHLRIFGAAHGASTIEDFRMAGVHARLYHYAAYLTPALIKQASGVTAYTAFASLLMPLGICLTGLGAYVLVASFWGPLPGVLACTALLFLPDGVQQGTSSHLLSYHWLTQISPGGTVGIAIVALAWLFVIRGCQRGSFAQIATGWLLGALVTFYKAQFFIASALPLTLVPALFARSHLRRWHRVVWAAGTVAAFVAGVSVTQRLPGFPLIRLDGSSTTWLLDMMSGSTESEAFKVFARSVMGASQPWLVNLVVGPVYLLVSVFGAFVALLAGLAIAARKRVPALLLWFPFVLIVNFLVMAMGLARDGRGVGTPEELLHRPFMLMYFVVVAWIGGWAGLLLPRSSRWLGRVARVAVLALPLPLFAVPAVFGADVQILTKAAGMSNLMFPHGQVNAAEYMRIHGKPGDIFQDSSFDRYYLTAALSERRPYVEHMLVRVRYGEELLNQRTAQVIDWMATASPKVVLAKAKALGIRWFLLWPGHRVAWPSAIAVNLVFERAGFQLYRFD
jgi:hypothetical protein